MTSVEDYITKVCSKILEIMKLRGTIDIEKLE